MATGVPKARVSRAALFFILVTVGLDMLAFGIVLPVLPSLIEQLSGRDTSGTAAAFGAIATAWAVAQFVCAPVLGALSDRFGRRPVVLAGCFALALDYVLMAVAPTLAWVFLGRVLAGMASANAATACAYIADVTPAEKRAEAFGLLGAAFGVGFVLGPAMGGLLGSVDVRLPFWAAAVLSLLNACYGFFVLPESLSEQSRMRFSWRRANPLGSLRLLASHRELWMLSAVLFVIHLAHMALPSVSVLYMGYRFGWGEAQIGFTLAAIGLCVGVVQALLVRPSIRQWGERGTLMLGLASGAAGFTLYALANQAWMFWAAIPVVALWGMAEPAAQALATRRVSVVEQGQLQGAHGSLESVAGIVGPALFTLVFAIAVRQGGADWSGLPFLLTAGLAVLGAWVAWVALHAGRGE